MSFGEDRGEPPNRENRASNQPGRYSSVDDSGGILPKELRQASTGAEDPRAPGFPTLEQLKELNRDIHDRAGTPEHYRLDQPSRLESSLASARAKYEPTSEGVIAVAASLAHGIAAAQSFFDGNRRTAYFATLSFLEENGLSEVLLDGDDHMLARYLNQVVEQPLDAGKNGPERFFDLFIRRLERRRSNG